MKKTTIKHILFAALTISAIASISATIPYAISRSSKNFNLRLNQFNQDLGKAKNLVNSLDFNYEKFSELAHKLSPKLEYTKRLNAEDVLNLHFDSSYNFDINQSVDFSELKQEFPGFNFKLILPNTKNSVKIIKNIIKNVGVLAINSQEKTNYSTNIDLDFSKQEKHFKFSPENLKAAINLAKLDFLKDKTATEIAILFNSDFYKNFQEASEPKSALSKTFAKYGGISLSLNSNELAILPSNYELEPELRSEKLVFSEINDSKNSLILKMNLYEKSSKKIVNFPLEFLNLPDISQNYEQKFLDIFNQNYELKQEVSKNLATNNLKPREYLTKEANRTEVSSDFTNIFSNKIAESEKNFIEKIKEIIPNFEPKKVSFKLVNFPENLLKNEYLIPIEMQVFGNFSQNLNLPFGIKSNNEKQYIYNFKLNFDASDSIYSSHFKNAFENFDKKESENLDNLTFEIKQDLPITIFASTIDDKIKHLLNVPLELENISKKMAPLFAILNFSANKNEIIEPEKAKTPQPQLAQKTLVSTALFAEETSTNLANPSQTPTTPEIPQPTKKENAGDYLKKLFEHLEKEKFPKNTVVFLSTFYKEKYTITIEIKTNNITEKKFEIEIDKVSKNNEAYQALAASSEKVHLFLDWRSNLETQTKLDEKTKKPLLTSIAAANNENLKFKVDSHTTSSTEVPYLDVENQGIYLAEKGISLVPITDSKNKDLKLDKGTTIFYAFKPKKLLRDHKIRYFLLKSRTSNEKEFSLIIEPDLSNEKYNRIGADFVGKESFSKVDFKEGKVELKWWKKTGTQLTFDGDSYLKEDKEKKQTAQAQESKNIIANDFDFLNDPDATIILTIDTEEKDGNSLLKINFYSSKYENAKTPKFQWEYPLPEKDVSIDLSKNLTFGTTSSYEQLLTDAINSLSNTKRDYAGIVFKGFALFEKPKKDKDYKDFFEKFRSQYI